MIGQTNGVPISITGLGCHVPERVLTNEELSTLVDTNDEWIIERTGIRERRIARDDEALTDIALPACRRALEMAGVAAKDIDLVIVATVTPDMSFPSAGALIADELGMPDAAAYDLSAGCTGFVYAIAQAHGDARGRAWPSARSWSAATCSRRSSTGRTARRSSSSATARARS